MRWRSGISTAFGEPGHRSLEGGASGDGDHCDGEVDLISTGYAMAGVLYELHKTHYGKDDSPVYRVENVIP
jgi:hypothetical protein